jgi:hypothetical protein
MVSRNSRWKHGTDEAPEGVETCMDDDERKAIRAEGLDPDDPAVRSALDLVRWELELLAIELFGERDL